ncbi:MAG: ABC transporter ATP-binding protein [Clostridiales bacterium]|nr:ABC transporter ATP-binding protein [Clostridiales bacterium]
MEAILTAQDLTKRYGNTVALSNLNLNLPRGKIIGLLGPNGSGKTTFLKLAAGLLVPTAGRIRVNALPIGEKTKSLVSYLPERTYLPMHMRVRETLDYFEDFYADFDRARANSMLEALQVPTDARMRELSKGTKEKVQLVLVMARRAQLYLLDEPIGGVDPATRDFILQTIVSNFHEESTVLISTHLIWDVEKVLDEFIFLQKGVITRYDETQKVREETGLSLDELFREVFRC